MSKRNGYEMVLKRFLVGLVVGVRVLAVIGDIARSEDKAIYE